MAAASPPGSRDDSDVGVAPHFHTANVVSKNSLLLGKPMATKSPGFTPFAAKARARRLALRSSWRQLSVSAPWLIAIASFGLRSACQRGTSAMGISMRAFPRAAPEGALLRHATARRVLHQQQQYRVKACQPVRGVLSQAR